MTTTAGPLPTASLVTKGAWALVEDHLLAVWDGSDAALDTALRALGYVPWTGAGRSTDAGAAGIRAFSSDTGRVPPFLLMMEDGRGGHLFSVYASTASDAEEMLAGWERTSGMTIAFSVPGEEPPSCPTCGRTPGKPLSARPAGVAGSADVCFPS
ncbi:hypothetical protein [Nocardiopsis ansamitocini]|nr:hypothetical protein [Nocardiopsis ansamitocini]